MKQLDDLSWLGAIQTSVTRLTVALCQFTIPLDSLPNSAHHAWWNLWNPCYMVKGFNGSTVLHAVIWLLHTSARDAHTRRWSKDDRSSILVRGARLTKAKKYKKMSHFSANQGHVITNFARFETLSTWVLYAWRWLCMAVAASRLSWHEMQAFKPSTQTRDATKRCVALRVRLERRSSCRRTSYSERAEDLSPV